MWMPPSQTADDASEASDGASHPIGAIEATSLDKSTLFANVEPWETSEPSAKRDLADIAEARLAEMDLGSNDGLQIPSTARDLYDASPRESPSPEPHRRQERLTPGFGPVEINREQLPSEFVAGFQHLNLAHGRETYSVNNEALPVMPVFDKGFQDCLKSGKAIADGIHGSLSACGLVTDSSSELGRLRASAASLKSYESPASRLIGIVGDSAAGKSSLINSLLDIPDLAHKGDHGSATTSFVTEYHRRSYRHEAPFTIEAEYCNEAETNEQLHELLVSYRELYQPGTEKELEHNEQLHQEVATKSEVAASTLQSIFPDHPEVTSNQPKDQSEGAFQRILQNLRRLASLTEWPTDAVNGRWTVTAVNAAQCHDKVAYFMKKGLWPLTNVVRIYLNAQVLKTGVILADLPGYRDTNLARVKKTEQYLLRCDEVFIVARMDRVVSDQSVERLVSNQMKASGRRKPITIVCTRADDLDLPTAEEKYKSIVDSEAGKKASQASKIAWERDQAAAAQIADTEYKYLFVSARNTNIERAVRQRYESSHTRLSVDVFCIGNRDYEGAGYRSQEARQRALQGSGIPDLRRFCHSIVAQAQYEASLHFLEVELASLVQSLAVCFSVSEQENVITIDPHTITDLQANLEQEIDDYVKNIEATIESGIADPMMDHDREFNDHALKMSQEWAEWDWTSYRAFCRQKGDYFTPTVGWRSWNAELLGDMNETMTEKWSSLHQSLEPINRELQKSVANACKETRDGLKTLGAPRTVLASFELKECELTYLLKNTLFDTNKELQTIESNALGDHVSSFISDLMIPTYRACTSETGPGTKARMHSIMRRRLGKRDLFTSIRRRVKEETSVLWEQKMDIMRESVVGMCDEVRCQLKAFGEKERDEWRVKEREVQVVKGAVERATEEYGVLWGRVEGVKGRGSGGGWREGQGREG